MYIETKVLTIAFTSYKTLKKKKKKKIDLEIVSLPHFQHNFWRKIFLMLYFNWPNFNVWLPLGLEILGNKCIEIICFAVDHIIIIEINLNFLIMPFPTWLKKSGKKLNIVRTKRGFEVKIKRFFHHFLRVFIEANKANFFGRQESDFNIEGYDGFLKKLNKLLKRVFFLQQVSYDNISAEKGS